jgi:ABC-type Fe3+/spermidine/putrescine transport system ATPase subunit
MQLGQRSDFRRNSAERGDALVLLQSLSDYLEPRILLMDEPLSNLDAALSGRLRREILRLHAELALTLARGFFDPQHRDTLEAMKARVRKAVLCCRR